VNQLGQMPRSVTGIAYRIASIIFAIFHSGVLLSWARRVDGCKHIGRIHWNLPSGEIGRCSTKRNLQLFVHETHPYCTSANPNPKRNWQRIRINHAFCQSAYPLQVLSEVVLLLSDETFVFTSDSSAKANSLGQMQRYYFGLYYINRYCR
jgi:hypothetical protein